MPILWNINDNFLGKNHTIFICEGQWDTLSFIEHGFKAIGIPGATNWKSYIEYLRAFQSNNVCNFVIVYDNDNAGRSEAKAFGRDLGCHVLNWKKLIDRLEKIEIIDAFDKINFTEGTIKDINDLNKHFYKLFKSIVEIIPECSTRYVSQKDVFDDMDELIEQFAEGYQLIDIGKSSKISDTYVVINKNKKIIPIFDNNKNACPLFKNIICDEYLDGKTLRSKIGTSMPVQFTSFFKSLSRHIAYQDKYLKIKKVDISNLCVIKNNRIIYQSDIDNDILIMQDNENILYPKLDDNYTKEELQEVDNIFNLLFDNNANLVKAHIISSIINENSGNKHLLFITGSAQTGKSKTAELIARIIQNKYITFPIGSLESIWDNFFKYRVPVLDNIDKVRDFNENIASQLAEILTATYVVKNVRYTPAGKEFRCDTYPIMTSTIYDLLDDRNYTAIKSRAVLLQLEFNEYAKDNLDKFYNNKKFIDKARLFFWKKAEEYLINQKDVKETLIEHRARNFFKVLRTIDNKDFIQLQKELYEYREYTDIIVNFLKVLKDKNLENVFLLPKTFNDEYQILFPNDKINSRNIMRYHILKQVLGGKLGDYTIKIKRDRDGKKYGFFLDEHLQNLELDLDLENTKDDLKEWEKKNKKKSESDFFKIGDENVL